MMIDLYRIKSGTREAFKHTRDYKKVIDMIWRGQVRGLNKSQTVGARPEQLIATLKRKCGDSLEVLFSPGCLVYSISLKNCSWYLEKKEKGCMLFCQKSYNGGYFLDANDVEFIADFMIAFDQAGLIIKKEFEKCMQARQKKKLLREITENTARGMIAEMEKSGVICLPEGYIIKGTDKGRVTVYFDFETGNISAPLDHLKARLLKRFSNKGMYK